MPHRIAPRTDAVAPRAGTGAAGGRGLELLKTLGRLYVQRTEANPTYQLVAGSVGLLVFLNAVNQVVLFAAALTATSTAGRPADLAEDDDSPELRLPPAVH